MTRLYAEQAAIYDLAFDWDVSEDAAWIHSRLGDECRSVLEPGCGSGRIVEALARGGVEAMGLDRSPQMIELARGRLHDLDHASAVLADITNFSLGRLFDGAVCPINTLLHLSPSELVRHLDVMAVHLRPGARYLIQLALHDPANPAAAMKTSRWEIARGDTALHVTWAMTDSDLDLAELREHSRIEVLSGPRAGEVFEESHKMTAWVPMHGGQRSVAPDSTTRLPMTATETIARASVRTRRGQCFGTS
jgi:SAM-dependent methyltransferase